MEEKSNYQIVQVLFLLLKKKRYTHHFLIKRIINDDTIPHFVITHSFGVCDMLIFRDLTKTVYKTLFFYFLHYVVCCKEILKIRIKVLSKKTLS